MHKIIGLSYNLIQTLATDSGSFCTQFEAKKLGGNFPDQVSEAIN